MEYQTKQEFNWKQISCPKTGKFIGYKKAFEYPDNRCPINCIVVLEIPEDAERVSADLMTLIKNEEDEITVTRKCRASKAKVLRIEYLDGTKAPFTKAVSKYNINACLYNVGEMVYPDSFDDNPKKACSNGIHFFMRREDAVNY